MSRSRAATIALVLASSTLVACAAVLGLPDPVLDETAGQGDANDEGASNDGAPSDGTTSDGKTDGASPDANVDGGPCNMGAPWGNITLLQSLDTTADEDMPTLTADEQTIYFRRGPPDIQGSKIMVAQRADGGSLFGAAQVAPLPASNVAYVAPCVTATGSKLEYSSATAPTDFDIFWVALPAGGPSPQPEVPVKSPELDFCGSFATSGAMYMWRQSFNAANATTYFRADFDPATMVLTAPVELPGFQAGTSGMPILGPRPVISGDQLTIFYEAHKDDSSSNDVFTATRAKTSDPFSQHKVVTELSDPQAADGPGWLSPDGCRLYFSSTRTGGSGGRDLYLASRPK